MPATSPPVVVREAEAGDLETVAAAYAHYVLTTPATFDLTPPELSVWEARRARTLPGQVPGDQFLVAEAAGRLLGFSYSSAYRPKAAYATTRETSVYTLPGAGGRGVGLSLYRQVLAALDAQGTLLTVANIAEPNPASSALHARCGFTPVGTLTGVGVKFGLPRDVTLWQRRPNAGPTR